MLKPCGDKSKDEFSVNYSQPTRQEDKRNNRKEKKEKEKKKEVQEKEKENEKKKQGKEKGKQEKEEEKPDIRKSAATAAPRLEQSWGCLQRKAHACGTRVWWDPNGNYARGSERSPSTVCPLATVS